MTKWLDRSPDPVLRQRSADPSRCSRGPAWLFTDAFRELIKLSHVKTVKLPARSPDLNAYAERFVLSIKSECLDQLIPLSEVAIFGMPGGR